MNAIEILEQFAPAALRTEEEGGGASNVSTKYKFMPTLDVVRDLELFGWYVHSATQQKSKDGDKTAKHQITFRQKDEHGRNPSINGNIPEIVMVNAHDCTSSFRFYVGINRIISNKSIIIFNKDVSNFKVRHMGYSFEFVKELVNKVTKQLPILFQIIENFERINLDGQQKRDLAYASYALKHADCFDKEKNIILKNKIDKQIDINDIISPMREEDKGDNLWLTFNVIQERITSGDYDKKNINSNVRKARPVSNIRKNIIINKGMWELAEKYLK